MVLCALAFITIPVLTSCKKYIDGPAFSLRTKKNRLQGEWKLDSYSVNGADKTSDFTSEYGANYMLDIEKGGKYKVSGNKPDAGTWSLGEDKDDVYFQSSTTGTIETSFRILRLANKELWVRNVSSNGVMSELKLKQ